MKSDNSECLKQSNELKQAVKIISNGKYILLSTTILAIVIAIIYIAITPNTYKTKAHLSMVDKDEFFPLNINIIPNLTSLTLGESDLIFQVTYDLKKDMLVGNKELVPSTVSPLDIFETFQHNLIKKNLIHEHYKKFNNVELPKKYEKIIVTMKGKRFYKDNHITVEFEHNDPKIASAWLNSYFEFIEKYTIAEVKDRLTKNFQKQQELYEQLFKLKVNATKKSQELKLARLKKAYSIAQLANIKNAQIDLYQIDNNADYLKGTTVLKAEIDDLTEKIKIKVDTFPLLELTKTIRDLNIQKIQETDLKIYYLEEEANVPTSPSTPNKPLIILFAVITGLGLGSIIVTLKNHFD